MRFDINKIRDEFPILKRKVNGYPFVYLDNAATSQKPKAVIDSIVNYYSNYNSNIHRGIHTVSQEATDAYENARHIIQTHFNIKHSHEIIFTSGTTHSINLVANGFENLLNHEDEILISGLEHHSNIVPWQMMCQKNKAQIKVIPMNENGELNFSIFEKLLSKKTKLVFVTHISNALGTINPIKEIIQKAHEVGAVVLVDGAQACSHFKTDLQELNADFYTTSAHKLCGPTGIGMLYGKEEWLKKMPPYQGGGEMISNVTFEKTTYAELPHKFEAGTPNIVGAIGFGEAINYLNKIGFDNIKNHESNLLKYATKKLKMIPNIKIYGDYIDKTSVISFNIGEIHSYDIGAILDKFGIAVRTGQHCAQPIMDYFKISGTVRVSFSFYNTIEEIDYLHKSLLRAVSMLS
ncbi:MAG: cysteine desulfurase [Flavobacteriaceae bacterium]|jgi:cysteine desulfurase/selenocysteine lyase|nr:cysteine desulfurase [Flavobacteriaceae bacterium]MBT3794510.1 cysteine desulfurase [Flavobacteriaceae bacterium]MBT4415156.1 cysteine desulfurase [Flavobacteriaceae bacterium]MBT5395490.1 cysteine desulfurase [Flavobacteriaceae bacterium]MBT5857909.1 cysteine desulfurase [Flavobacteriaceae bacterium]